MSAWICAASRVVVLCGSGIRLPPILAVLSFVLIDMLVDDIKALVFDVFGTCVDWRGSVIREVQAVAQARGVTVDVDSFADEWRREGYIRGIARIRAGEMPYVSSDTLFRRKLDELLPKYGL